MTSRGGVADEAGRLLNAVEGWLRSASDDAAGEHAPPGVVRDLFATAAQAHPSDPPCEICPVCRVIAAVRAARPDIVEHLVDAAGSVLLALRAFTEPHAGGTETAEDEPTAPPSTVVQHITVN